MGHVPGAIHASVILILIEFFHPLERTYALQATIDTISSLPMGHQALYLFTTGTITTNFLSVSQWPSHIPLTHILFQPSPLKLSVYFSFHLCRRSITISVQNSISFRYNSTKHHRSSSREGAHTNLVLTEICQKLSNCAPNRFPM